MSRIFRFSLLVTLFLSIVLFFSAQSSYAANQAVRDLPTPLVDNGNRGSFDYALVSPKVFWVSNVPTCPVPLTAAKAKGVTSKSSVSLLQQEVETLSRIATYGSSVRQLYTHGENCGYSVFGPNITADNNFIYWLSSVDGNRNLMKLSTNANPGDPPQLMNSSVNKSERPNLSEVADGVDRIYTLINYFNNYYTPGYTEIGYVLKATNQFVLLATPQSYYVNSLASDGQYVYFLVDYSTLVRIDPKTGTAQQIATNVDSYYAEGRQRSSCGPIPFHVCFTSNVYYGKGNSIYIYDNETNKTSAPIYTSHDTNAKFLEMVTHGSFSSYPWSGQLFFFEQQTVLCPNPPCLDQQILLQRLDSSTNTVDSLYASTNGIIHLSTDGTFLFWQDSNFIQRLPANAAALPVVNMHITSIEVTQGIQNTNNNVLLVKDRRTFVRVYVKSDGAPVPGVGATLFNTAIQFDDGLAPVNPVGTHITIRGIPDRNDLNQSFLFELPLDWTLDNSLSLHVELNPSHYPLEPNYDDNGQNITVNFNNSPRLSAEFFRFNYSLTTGGQVYSPRLVKDVLQTYSWIMRAYPIGGSIGQYFKPRLWDVAGGTVVGQWVNRSSSDCTASKIGASDLQLCASYYTNGWLADARTRGLVPNRSDFYYGMISDSAGFFPRGQELSGSLNSTGPAGIPNAWRWDTDGSYADWYAGHEIGHSLGRQHPNAGSDDPSTPNMQENCGHSRSDPNFPYGDTSNSSAPIGPIDGSMEGFDVGDAPFGIQKAVYPSSIWNDVMSYCSYQWVSDYTYTAMYNYMIAHPTLEIAAASIKPSAVVADFLAVAGKIDPTANTGGFSLVRRLGSIANMPPITPGDYSIQLLNAQNQILASTAFTPNANPDMGNLDFSQVVNFMPGTRTIQIVQMNSGHVLVSTTVSANPPIISNVALQGATNPVRGTVSLAWNASDPDGDSLTFDVIYSRDNGATFQPVATNIIGNNTQIDTTQLGGGGQAILQVTASDGVNSTAASTLPFVMANKPPQPYILNPANNVHMHYSQLVNFNAMAFDAQDATVADNGFVWKNAQGSTLGTGQMISLDKLPVGQNVITVTAMNSIGASSSVSVTVNVDDDLNLPGPTLTIAPTQVGWQVPNGTTQVQTTQLTVSNAGSGNLNWNASSDQAWLTLSPLTGIVSANDNPQVITLTANPSNLPNNTGQSAHITITTSASDIVLTQTVTALVTLSLGDVRSISDQAEQHRIYLPLVIR